MIKVVKKEILKLLDVEMIYVVSNSPWISPVHFIQKKVGIMVEANHNGELVLVHKPMG